MSGNAMISATGMALANDMPLIVKPTSIRPWALTVPIRKPSPIQPTPNPRTHMAFFPDVAKIKYEGPDSKNPLAFRHYNPDEVVEGKTMKEHLRFSVCYWHTFRGTGSDPFGPGCAV